MTTSDNCQNDTGEPDRTPELLTPSEGVAIAKLASRLGLSFDQATGKWEASLFVDGQKVNLGLFSDPSQAISARRAFERRLTSNL